MMSGGLVVEFPQHRPGTHGVNLVSPKQKRRHDAKIPATPSKGPEQVGVLLCAGDHDLTTSLDHVGGQQVVDREAVLSC